METQPAFEDPASDGPPSEKVPACTDRAIDPTTIDRSGTSEETADVLPECRDLTAADTTSELDEARDFFPLLALPVELILIIFSFLTTDDRWRARVCKRLLQIEESVRWTYTDPIDVDAWGIDQLCSLFPTWTGGVYIVHPIVRAVLEKMAKHVDLKMLTVDCAGNGRCRFPITYAKRMSAETLVVEYEDWRNDWLEVTADSTIAEWMGGRKHLQFIGPIAFSGEALFQVFSDMEAGRCSLQQLQFGGQPGPTPEATRKLLQLLGLTWDVQGFQSTRKDLELFTMPDGVPLEEDEYCVGADDYSYTSAALHLIIIIGWRCKLSIRKWIFTDQAELPFDRAWAHHNELAIELFDETGAPPSFDPFLDFTIADVRLTFDRVPVTYV